MSTKIDSIQFPDDYFAQDATSVRLRARIDLTKRQIRDYERQYQSDKEEIKEHLAALSEVRAEQETIENNGYKLPVAMEKLANTQENLEHRIDSIQETINTFGHAITRLSEQLTDYVRELRTIQVKKPPPPITLENLRSTFDNLDIVDTRHILMRSTGEHTATISIPVKGLLTRINDANISCFDSGRAIEARIPDLRVIFELDLRRPSNNKISIRRARSKFNTEVLGPRYLPHKPHPHVERGNPCWGDYAAPVTEAMDKLDIISAFYIVLAFLRTTVHTDAWGQDLLKTVIYTKVFKERLGANALPFYMYGIARNDGYFTYNDLKFIVRFDEMGLPYPVVHTPEENNAAA